MPYTGRQISSVIIDDDPLDKHRTFKETLTVFTINCLIDKPDSIVEYAADYFENLKTDITNMDLNSTNEGYGEIPDYQLARHKVVYSEPYSPKDDDSISNYELNEKTGEEKEILTSRVKKCLLFKNLDNEDLQKVVNAMVLKETVPEEVVVKIGDEGDNFYLIENGVFNAFDENEELINVYENEGEFGELALMYNQPRAATVISTTAGKLWALPRQIFRRIVLKAAYKKRKLYEDFLNNVEILEPLDNYERLVLADAIVPKHYTDGEIIIEQGNSALGMYFVEKGNVKVMISNKKTKQVNVVGPGGYFGELALLLKKPRAATVIAMGDVKVAFLDVDVFERLLGPCVDIMKRHIEVYENQVSKIFGSRETICGHARKL